MQILPNGRVKIQNFQTGESKEVDPGELPTYGGDKLLNQYIKLRDLEKKEETEGFSLGAPAPVSSSVSTSDSPFFDSKTPVRADGPTLPPMPSGYTREKYQADLARDIQTTGGKHATELKQLFEASNPQEDPVARDRRKSEQSSSAVMSFIDNLEKSYKEAGGATYGVGPGARVKGFGATMAGKFGLNDSANVYNKSKAGFAATLKTITGDTGPLTDPDYERLAGLLPDFGATKAETIDLFNQLREAAAAKFGIEKTKTGFQPKVENTRGVLPSMLDVAFDPAVDLAEKAQKDLSKQLETGNYKTILDLMLPKSDEDVGIGDVASAGVKTGLTLAAMGDVTKMFKGAVDKIFGGSGKLLANRQTLAEGKKAITKGILEAGDDFVKNIEPAAAKDWQTLKTAIKNETDLPSLLKKLTTWGNKAYTKSGEKSTVLAGELRAHITEAGRSIIKDQYPEIAKITSEIGRKIAFEKATKLKNLLPAIIGGAGTTLGGIAIGKAMGQKR